MDWTAVDLPRVLHLLNRWRQRAERDWYDLPGQPGLGCYGTGYNTWGVQTNQKYLSAMAVLATRGAAAGVPQNACDHARERALAALRFSLRSHCSGDLACTDGTSWGHTWISALGVERMMHGVLLLEPYLTADDQAMLRRMLVSETIWIANDLVRGKTSGVVATKWNAEGGNVPESNIWNGAILWRTAVTYPDEPGAAAWREQAHRFFMNSVSVPADEFDERVVAGKPIRDWYVGPNFFPNYALDHHGYLNVGYQVICLSNAAMLHFDLKAMGAEAPESLHHHQADLWDVVRREVFADGRLARIGGDSRVRYAYCQEYLLPSLAYAADQFGDRHAAGLAAGQVGWTADEAGYHADGSFYGSRLSYLAQRSPYYLTRLESDRACALGQLVRYAEQLADPGEPAESYEASVAGGWAEPEHGAVLHRSPTRLASVAWRAYGLTQAMCQPPDDGHLADWCLNLAGEVRALGDDGAERDTPGPKRKLLECGQTTFDGGFVTWGTVLEGCGVTLAEGWTGSSSARHLLAYAALPDGQTMVGLQVARAADHRAYFGVVKGLRLNVPCDLQWGFESVYTTAEQELTLRYPPRDDQRVELTGRWAVVNGRLAVIGIGGADTLTLDRAARRRGGTYESLLVDQLCFGYRPGPFAADPGEVILDVAWAVVSGGNRQAAAAVASEAVWETAADLRWVTLPGQDRCRYVVMVNSGESPASLLGYLPADAIGLGDAPTVLAPGQAGLWRC